MKCITIYSVAVKATAFNSELGRSKKTFSPLMIADPNKTSMVMNPPTPVVSQIQMMELCG